MVKARSGASFLLEAVHALLVGSDLSGQNFQGDRAREFRVFGKIYLAHPARANLRADFIATQSCSGSDCHCFSVRRAVAACATPLDKSPQFHILQKSTRLIRSV